MPTPLLSIEKLSDDELLKETESALAEAEKTIAERRAYRVLKAQMLIQERAARQQRLIVEEQRKQARLMMRCTVWMTVLTVVITIMTAALLWKTFFPA